MIEVYIGAGVVISIIGIIGSVAVFSACMDDADGFVKSLQMATMVMTLAFVLAWTWPLLLALALPGLILYGLWCWARAIKHKTIHFDEV